MLFVQRLCLAYWVGSMLFFSFLFAPRVFRVLERADAAKLQNALFPSYFASLSVASLICAIVFFLKKWKLQGALSTAALLIFLTGLFYLTPEISRLYETQAPKQDFAFLHKSSMALNLVGLIVGVLLLRKPARA